MTAARGVLVCGLGLTGLSLARHWSGRGARVDVMDTRERPPLLDRLREELPDCEFRTGPVERMVEVGAQRDVVALSPGLAAAPFAPLGDAVVGDIKCFFDALGEADSGPEVVAVTGTNGKSTLVSMIDHTLRGCGRRSAAVGNIGLPVLDALGQWVRDGEFPEFAAVEMSSFQLETVGRVPARVSVVLNVSEDHLDRHGDLQRYADVKSRVYSGAGCAVVNRDDIFCAAMNHGCPEERGFAAGGDNARDGDWRVETGAGGDPVLSDGGSGRFPLPGKGMSPTLQGNAAAAMAATEPLGIDPARRVEALGGFTPLPHRLTPVGTVGSVSFYDDSKATNIDAAIAAMRSFADNRTVLIAGGDAKSQHFSRLAMASRGKVGHFVLIGADADEIASALDAENIPSSRAGNMREAVALAYSLAPDSGRVVLSPACSSLDMYPGYAARGDDFARTVRKLSVNHVA